MQRVSVRQHGVGQFGSILSAVAAHDFHSLLQRCPFFASLPHHQLDVLASLLSFRVVEPGHTLFKQGDEGEAFYVLVHGELIVTSSEQPLYTLAPTTFIVSARRLPAHAHPAERGKRERTVRGRREESERGRRGPLPTPGAPFRLLDHRRPPTTSDDLRLPTHPLRRRARCL